MKTKRPIRKVLTFTVKVPNVSWRKPHQTEATLRRLAREWLSFTSTVRRGA